MGQILRVSHPEHIVHRMWEIQFDFGKIFENFSSLDKFFGYFTPLIWPLGWLILVVILLLGIYQLKRDWRKGLSLVFGIVFIVITLGINKVNDNIDTIFLSSTRMFLGIPLLSGLAFFWNRDLLKVSDKYLKFGMVAMVVTVVFSKSSFSEMVVNQHVNKAVAGGAMPVKRKTASGARLCQVGGTCFEGKNRSDRFRTQLGTQRPQYGILQLWLSAGTGSFSQDHHECL
ncbi:MAG: hypothetical protein IPN95_09755 [Bacteroidetes bacterium]|nr:hypothetical protein [Bacteroidota bacterium]